MAVVKRVSKIVLIILGIIVLLVAGLLAYLTITDYHPGDMEALELSGSSGGSAPSKGDSFTVTTFNTGYCALSESEDFFMDGGKTVRPESSDLVAENLRGILAVIKGLDSDVYFLQEVDRNSHRSYGIDQFASYIGNTEDLSGAFATNYKCGFVPYPLPFIGRVESGVATLTSLPQQDARRMALPSPFIWPVSTANLKRCALISRVPLTDGEGEVVLVNVHLDAYDDGGGRIRQTLAVLDFAYSEYDKGNYVIIGGDFNQQFPSHKLELVSEGLWEPLSLESYELKDGWAFVDGGDEPTCRLLNEPYTSAENPQFYIIDGFVISPNLSLEKIETHDLSFKNSDHNPVSLTVKIG